MKKCNIICDICQKETIHVSIYGEWKCVFCGQCYEYNEGHVIVLSPDQLELLRSLLIQKTQSFS